MKLHLNTLLDRMIMVVSVYESFSHFGKRHQNNIAPMATKAVTVPPTLLWGEVLLKS